MFTLNVSTNTQSMFIKNPVFTLNKTELIYTYCSLKRITVKFRLILKENYYKEAPIYFSNIFFLSLVCVSKKFFVARQGTLYWRPWFHSSSNFIFKVMSLYTTWMQKTWISWTPSHTRNCIENPLCKPCW